MSDALRWAQALAEARDGEGGAHEILLGLLLHQRPPRSRDAARFLWEWLQENLPQGVTDPFIWFDWSKAPVPSSVASEPTKFTADANELLATAAACARAVSNTNRVSMRHLVGALLLGPRSFGHAQAAGLVGEKGFSFQALSTAYLEFIRRTLSAERDAWSAWGEQPDVERPQVPRPRHDEPRSIRAGYDADLPVGIDRLNIEDEVATLCSIILDANHPPPLSIGLFGDWGSGKSFFLGKMQDRIRDVTGEARQARERGILTTFVTRAPQIQFNAWHFVDANLWASLVTHLFAELHREVFGRKPAPDEQKAEELYQELETTQKRIQAIERDMRAVNDLVKQAADNKTQAEKELQDGKKTIEVYRHLSAESVEQLVLNKPEVRSSFDELSKSLGRAREAVNEIQALSRDLLTTAGTFRRFVRESWVLLLIVAALLLVGALLATQVGTKLLGQLQAWLASGVALLTGAVALGKKALPFLDRAKRLLRSAEAARQDILRESQGKLDQAEIARKEAVERLAAEEGKKRKLEKEIEEARRGLGLEGFLQQRLGDSTYKAQLGIVAMVRQDFDTLTQRLRSSGIEIMDSKRKKTRIETVDRVILYIDDLDRCPPERVVEVLQAVHLLCAVPLFVVVVAADPRWLYHSLRKHYAELLETEGGDEQARLDWEEERWESTPQQYLEKIFQIPYTLPAMGDGGFRELVKSLLEPERVSVRPSDAEAQVTPPQEKEGTPAQGRTQEKAGERPTETPESKEQTPELSPPASGLSSRTADGKDEAKTGQGQAVQKEWKPRLDLAPKSLELTQAEKDFLQGLSPLVSTPRSAKRLVNVYRLLRANLSPEDLRRIEQGEFQAVQILLGVLIGFPDQAPELFLLLCDEDPEEDFWSFIKKKKSPYVMGQSPALTRPRSEHRPPRPRSGVTRIEDDEQEEETRSAAGGLPPGLPEELRPHASPAAQGLRDASEWRRMCEAVERLCGPYAGSRAVQAFRPWVDAVSRYSFQAGHLLRNLENRELAQKKA